MLLALLPWTLLGGGGGCISKPPPPPSELCPPTGIGVTPASPGTRFYAYDTPGKIVDARGVDWAGQDRHGVELGGNVGGCFQGGGITGTWDVASTWETFHLTAALSVEGSGQPMRVHAMHARNYGDAVSIEPGVPCPNGSLNPWLYVHANHFEDIHDDAIESDGLCSVEITGNLIERAFVGFAFRNRASDRDRSGGANKVVVDGNLVRLHAFEQNWQNIQEHGALWKWAHEGRGPRIVVRNNRFLAFDPVGGLFPYVTRVLSCENNVFLFGGSEAEWAQALAGGCDDGGDDGLCTGERLLALSHCFTVITKPDSQSEADFLAEHWDPYVVYWKLARGADDE